MLGVAAGLSRPPLARPSGGPVLIHTPAAPDPAQTGLGPAVALVQSVLGGCGAGGLPASAPGQADRHDSASVPAAGRAAQRTPAPGAGAAELAQRRRNGLVDVSPRLRLPAVRL